MPILGFIVLFLAAAIHAWAGAQARQAAMLTSSPVNQNTGCLLVIHVALLLIGLVILWAGGSFILAAIGGIIYFFVFPLITVPILRAMGLIPPG